MEPVAATTKLNAVDVLRMQVARLLARVAAKDGEFAQERARLTGSAPAQSSRL